MRRIQRKPNHPGCILREDYIKPLKITITEMASRLGVSRKTLSKILNEKGSVTPDMALRLSQALSTTPELWLNLQKNYDLWHAENTSQEWKKIKPFQQNWLNENGSNFDSGQLH